MFDLVVTHWFRLFSALIGGSAGLKAAEEARRAAEGKAAEEARRAAEAKAAEEARRVAEVKAAEEARLAAEVKAAEEARRARRFGRPPIPLVQPDRPHPYQEFGITDVTPCIVGVLIRFPQFVQLRICDRGGAAIVSRHRRPGPVWQAADGWSQTPSARSFKTTGVDRWHACAAIGRVTWCQAYGLIEVSSVPDPPKDFGKSPRVRTPIAPVQGASLRSRSRLRLPAAGPSASRLNHIQARCVER
jgi:hypothetical protein